MARAAPGGLFAPRSGPAVAGGRLGGPLGLAWHHHRATVLVPGLSLLALGALLGLVAPVLPAQTGGVAVGFVVSLTFVLSEVAAAVAVVLGMRGEETDGRAEIVLAAAVRRSRWAGASVVVAVAGVALLGLGLGAGVVGGAALHPDDPTAALAYAAARLGEALAFVPSCLVMVGPVVALIGMVPRAAVAIGWTLIGAVFLLDLLGEFGIVPPAAAYASPFASMLIGLRTGATATAVTTVVLLVLAAALTAAGLAALRRRDLT